VSATLRAGGVGAPLQPRAAGLRGDLPAERPQAAVGGCTRLMQLTQSLKGAWYQPLHTYEVKNRFQAFAFHKCNLYCYTAAVRGEAARAPLHQGGKEAGLPGQAPFGGDPQPRRANRQLERARKGGAVHVDSPLTHS
jgi:protein involved in temperature-dependent protein secretion